MSSSATSSSETTPSTDAETSGASSTEAETSWTSGGVTSTSEGVTSSSDGTSTTTGAFACEPRPPYLCTNPLECDEPGDCGGPSALDEFGCLRPRCEITDECEPDEICYNPFDCDPEYCDFGYPSCGPCEEEADGCCCISHGGCGIGASVRYCIPADAKPC